MGIQVKATKMGVAEVHKEMCPGGSLKPSIRELIRRQGGYWIATTDSVADAEYTKRVTAMRAAVASEPAFEQAEFDYYDAQRLADWTNQHPGVVAWLRLQLGRPLQGWKGHGQWADPRGGMDRPFVLDEKHRFSDPMDRERSLSLVQGLVRVRQVLSVGGRSVRLTGLSGVGKTRFAQALFEESAAPDALSADLAVYTDTAYSPDPSPLALLDELVGARRRAVLVVDNCGAQLHRELTERCKVSELVSLLSIEYDIREDLPPETQVFQLDAGSPELIEKVIAQQFPQITQVNARKITEFAEGNSRVAIALASTMSTSDSLAGLSDRELFDRLFWLGKQPQEELKAAAEACSLVYSFNGEELDGELKQLATLTGESALVLYRRVSDLEQRGLAQKRGPWRAVLPHAIANALAADALKNLPPAVIHQLLVEPQGRLLRSFSRRLGYLHASSNATQIVRGWLSEGGLLGDVTGLPPLLMEVLMNVAPVDPASTLRAIKRGITGPRASELLIEPSQLRSRLVKMVRLIAYEPTLFEDCLDVLVQVVRSEPEDAQDNSTRDLIASMFMLYLSGTHATLKQRANWIRSALSSGDPLLSSIGMKALSAALQAHHFTSYHEFEFGARLRDYGAYPRGKDVREWFATFIDLAAHLTQGDGACAEGARDLLAQHFCSLWTHARMADELEAAIGPLLAAGWERGWLAIRETMRFDGKGLPPDLQARLTRLEERARPQTLLGSVKAIVLSGHRAAVDVDYADGENPSSAYARAEQRARELGRLVAVDPDSFKKVLPQVVADQQGRQWAFGVGLGDSAADAFACWAALVEAFEATPEDQRNVQVLRGFVAGMFERDRKTCDCILDGALVRPSLATFFPALQMSVALDERACERLLISMDNPAVSALEFQCLSLGRTTQPLEDERLAELLQRLSIKPNGLLVVIDILYMHIYDNPNAVGPLTTAVARDVVANAPLGDSNRRHDHELAAVIEAFAAGPDGEASARKMLTAVRAAIERRSLSGYDAPEMLAALFCAQPQLALDALIGDPDESEAFYRRHSALAGGHRTSAIAKVPIDDLLSWCKAGSEARWETVAALLPAFETAGGGIGDPEAATPRWSLQAVALLRDAPSPEKVAQALVELVEPSSWSGSRAEAIRRRLPLFDALAEILGDAHAGRVEAWRGQLTQVMNREARCELDEHRTRNERFE